MHVKIALVICVSLVVLLFSCNPQKRLAREKHEYMERAYIDIKKAITRQKLLL